MAGRLSWLHKVAKVVMRSSASIFVLGLLLGCASTLVIDPSISSVEARDYTLVMSACEAAPGVGLDICRVIEGTQIASSWKMVVPIDGKNVLGGEVRVFYRDIQKSYGLVAGRSTLEIPWAEFFGENTWSRDLDGEALALVSIRYKDNLGVEKDASFRGLAKIVVTSQSYTRMPIDSGNHAWGKTCRVQMSTAGRSALECK